MAGILRRKCCCGGCIPGTCSGALLPPAFTLHWIGSQIAATGQLFEFNIQMSCSAFGSPQCPQGSWTINQATCNGNPVTPTGGPVSFVCNNFFGPWLWQVGFFYSALGSCITGLTACHIPPCQVAGQPNYLPAGTFPLTAPSTGILTVTHV